jgi:hypothetical protein
MLESVWNLNHLNFPYFLNLKLNTLQLNADNGQTVAIQEAVVDTTAPETAVAVAVDTVAVAAVVVAAAVDTVAVAAVVVAAADTVVENLAVAATARAILTVVNHVVKITNQVKIQAKATKVARNPPAVTVTKAVATVVGKRTESLFF